MKYPTPEELQALRDQLAECLTDRKVVVVGVGNALRGDDALGVVLAERLEGKVGATVFHAYDVPENYAVRASALKPDVILLLDAANALLPPGSVRLAVAEDLPPVPGVSHRPSLEMFAAYVRLDSGAETYLVGVQPNLNQIGMGDDMSEEALHAIDLIEQVLLDVLPPADAQ